MGSYVEYLMQHSKKHNFTFPPLPRDCISWLNEINKAAFDLSAAPRYRTFPYMC